MVQKSVPLLGVLNPFYKHSFNDFHPWEYNLNKQNIISTIKRFGHLYFRVLCHIISNNFYLYLLDIYIITNSVIPFVTFNYLFHINHQTSGLTT